MATIGVAITKSTPFRGAEQEFSNVYHYKVPVDLVGGYQGIVDDIVAAERLLHSTVVKFKVARVWSAGGTPQQNETLLITDLTGTGSRTTDTTLDRERAILIQWDAGRSEVTGRKVYLRKWYHMCGSPVGGWSSMVLANTQAIAQSTRDEVAGYATTLKNVGPTIDDNWLLCSERGREAIGEAVCHPYLEHRQLGDAWRA